MTRWGGESIDGVVVKLIGHLSRDCCASLDRSHITACVDSRGTCGMLLVFSEPIFSYDDLTRT